MVIAFSVDKQGVRIAERLNKYHLEPKNTKSAVEIRERSEKFKLYA